MWKTVKRNASPLAGAFRCGDKWFAKITVNGRNYFLSVYDTRKEAVAAYRCAVRLLRGEFVGAKHRPLIEPREAFGAAPCFAPSPRRAARNQM